MRACHTCPHFQQEPSRLSRDGHTDKGALICRAAAPVQGRKESSRFPIVDGRGCGQHPENMAAAHLLFVAAVEGLTNGE